MNRLFNFFIDSPLRVNQGSWRFFNKPLALLLLSFILGTTNAIGQATCIDCDKYENVVVNGDFETGVLAPSTTDLPTGATCTPENYDIVTTSQDLCNHFTQILDQTNPGTGHFMMIDGIAGSSTVWEQSVQVVAGQTYAFSFWVNYPGADDYPVTLNILVDNEEIASFEPAVGGWIEYCIEWEASTAGTFPLTIQQPSGQGMGYDYAIDDIFFGHCINCDYDYLLSNFTGVMCTDDLVLDLSTWPSNFGSQITLVPAFGESQTIGIQGGQVYNLYEYFKIACGDDSCGVNPQYQLVFEADHPDCEFVKVTSDVFEVVCCEEPCEIEASFDARFRFRNICEVFLEDQSSIQNGSITGWQWEVYNEDGVQIFNSDQPSVTFERNFGSYVKICLTVIGNDGECKTTVCREWEGLAACSISDPIGIGPRSLESNVAAYPNPTTDELQVDLPFEAEAGQVSLVDGTGNRVEVPIKAVSKQNLTLDMSGLRKGTYYLTVQNDEHKESRTIVKQ